MYDLVEKILISLSCNHIDCYRIDGDYTVSGYMSSFTDCFTQSFTYNKIINKKCMGALGSQCVKYICKISQSVCTILSYPIQLLSCITIFLFHGKSSICVNSLILVLSIYSFNKLPTRYPVKMSISIRYMSVIIYHLLNQNIHFWCLIDVIFKFQNKSPWDNHIKSKLILLTYILNTVSYWYIN